MSAACRPAIARMPGHTEPALIHPTPVLCPLVEPTVGLVPATTTAQSPRRGFHCRAPTPAWPTSADRPCHVQTALLLMTVQARALQVRHLSTPVLIWKFSYFLQYFPHLLSDKCGPTSIVLYLLYMVTIGTSLEEQKPSYQELSIK